MKKPTRILPIISVAAALACAPACKSKKKRPPKTCRKKTVERVKKWMAALCGAKEATLAAAWTSGTKLKLATANRPPARRISRATFVRMEPGRLWINGTPVKGWKQKFAPPTEKKPAVGMLGVLAGAKELTGSALRLKSARDLSTDVLNLAVAPAVPVRQLSALLKNAHEAGFRNVVFLFRPKNPPRPPDPPSTSGYVRLGPKTGPQKVIVAAMKMVERSLKSWTGCKAVEDAFRVLGAAAPEERCRLLSKGLIVAIKECDCRGEIDPLLTAAHMLLQPYDPLAAWTLALDPRANPLKIDDGKRPWKEIVEEILKVPSNVRFWLATPSSGAPDPGASTAPRIGSVRPRNMQPSYFTGRRRVRSPVLLGKGRITGGLDRTVVRRVLRRHLSQIRYCFESRLLIHNRKAKGTLDLKFKVGLKGRVVMATVLRSSLKSAAVESCVKASARRWRFPPPKDQPVTGVYRYTFKPSPY
jgi:TonB family protein